MPTTRPGFIYGGPTDGWVAIGQEAAVNPFKYQATAPTSPATGDIWIDSDETVNSIDSTQFLRWRKTMVGGETSLSGNDDSSLPLRYTPGYEQLYINGVLQVRGQDYTATTGTTVTGLTALVANDVVEIFSAVARTVADVYTQTQSDAKYALKKSYNYEMATTIQLLTTGSWSSAYGGYRKDFTWTFPRSFSGTPSVTGSFASPMNGAGSYFIMAGGGGSTSITYTAHITDAYWTANSGLYVMLTAIYAP